MFVDMHERYGVEWPEQQFEHRQSSAKKSKSEVKQEKKMSKTESRFKSKLGKLIELPLERTNIIARFYRRIAQEISTLGIE